MFVFLFLGCTTFWITHYLFYRSLKSAHPVIWEEHKPNELVYFGMNPFFLVDLFMIRVGQLNPPLRTVLWGLRGLLVLLWVGAFSLMR